MRTPLVMAALAAAVVLTNVSLSKANTVYEETFSYYDGGSGASGQLGFQAYDWDSQATPGTGAVIDIGTNILTTAGAISLGGPNGNHVGGTGVNAGSSTLIGQQIQTATAGPIYYTAITAATAPTSPTAQTPFPVGPGVPTTRSPANDSTAYFYGLAYNNVADKTVFDYTKEYGAYSGGDALNTNNHPGLTFSWFEGNNDNAGGYSLAVEVSNQWYVTTKVFNNENVLPVAGGTTGLANGGFENNVAYTGTLAFNKLNFNGDYSFINNAEGVGTTATVSSVLSRDTVDGVFNLDTTQNIQAFGLFSDANTASSNRRFDAFTVTDSVPEPASLALIGVGSVVMLRRRRSI